LRARLGAEVRAMRTMSVAALALALAVALALAACGGGGSGSSNTAPRQTTATVHSESAGQFMIRVDKYWAAGQWGRVWKLLHPVQQKLVTAEQLASYEDQQAGYGYPDPADAKYRVKESYPEAWVIPGGPKGTRPATAVTVQGFLETALENGTPAPSVLWTNTAHAFRVGHRWAWILGADELRTIKQSY
jgi:hypothetical protein